MTHVFEWRLQVRTYEIDSLGHVNNAIYARYLQEAATRASAERGYSYDWYMDNGVVWLIRKLWLRYYAPAVYGDELVVKTWVSDVRRVQSRREYEIRRARDGELVLRGRANWVYVDGGTLRPTRPPVEMMAAWEPSGELPDLGTRVKGATQFEGAHRYHHHRRVERYELDTLGHVNNAVYLNWVEQAVFEAVASVGCDEAWMREQGFYIVSGAHEIEYFNSAQRGDPIEIISWPYELGRARGAWIQEVRHAETGELLVRDYNVGVFVDADGRPTRPPTEFVERAVQGVK